MFRRYVGRSWNTGDEWKSHEWMEKRGCLLGQGVLHPAYLGAEYLHHLPPKYIFALCRAFADKGDKDEHIKRFEGGLAMYKDNEKYIQPTIRQFYSSMSNEQAIADSYGAGPMRK